ncbi:hypothetical protein M231_06223 [Tremella mesenterica]|uniref:Major facilitator superfamily (MFS) profile domain-containing protein n=1 Tax=Tremella mesenterica TaxID=5217 RepID=A0A4Q1BCE2_TREME|nr:hypothetical protein M231_06223 [Tremella mesenterica]
MTLIDIPTTRPAPAPTASSSHTLIDTPAKPDKSVPGSLKGFQDGVEVVKSTESDSHDPLSYAPVSSSPQLTSQQEPPQVPIAYVTGAKLWLILVLFCMSVYIDVTCRSGVMIFITAISQDLDVPYVESTWIIVAFAIPFATLLPFFGRIADLFSPKTSFVTGAALLGLACLIASVLTDKYSYWALRGLSGVFASATVPAAYRLILGVFPPHKQGTAIGVFALFGSVANASGLVLAGLFAFITTEGQMSAWRWFFRFVGILSVPISITAYLAIPKLHGAKSQATLREKWQQFDLIGCAILLGSTLMFMIGLTMGGINGWRSASFLVPFLLSWPLGISFFFWEKRLPDGCALVPPSTWKLPNLPLLLVVAVGILPMWPGQALPLSERWEQVESAAIVGLRLMPQGIFSALPMFVLPRIPQHVKASRYFLPVCFTVSAATVIVPIFSHGLWQGGAYWRWYFPSFAIGSFFCGCAFSGINVLYMMAIPPEMAGVASALLQVAIQMGGTLTFTLQGALLTVYPGEVNNFKNVQLSWWVCAGWYVLDTLIVLIGYREIKRAVNDEESGRSTLVIDSSEKEEKGREMDGSEEKHEDEWGRSAST